MNDQIAKSLIARNVRRSLPKISPTILQDRVFESRESSCVMIYQTILSKSEIVRQIFTDRRKRILEEDIEERKQSSPTYRNCILPCKILYKEKKKKKKRERNITLSRNNL